MVGENFILFDPVQFEEYGQNFHKEESFYFRYQSHRRLFLKNIYIPLGPVCETIEGFHNFLDHINSFKFSKVKIDLPLILDKKDKALIIESLEKKGFKKSEYVQDEETLIVSKSNFSLNKRNLRYVRKGLKDFDITLKESLSEEELKSVYDLYLLSSKKIGFTPKTFEAVKVIANDSLTALAINKSSGKISGFLMGYKIKMRGSEGKNILMSRLIFTAIDEDGQNAKLGFALHNEYFNKAFNELGYDMIDFHMASRTKGRTYVGFKTQFGGEFISFPGSYEKWIF